MSDRLTLRVQSTSSPQGGVIMPHRGHKDTVSIRNLEVPNGSSDDIREEIDEDNWRTFANCRGVSVDVFFPERGDPQDAVRKAKAYCLECPVKKRCLVVALENHPDNWGVFGGTTAKARRDIRKAISRNPNYLSSQEAQERYGLTNAY